LVVLCLVVYLPGFFSMPPVDRDESRFAQASRQMFESVALTAAYRDPARHGGGLAVPMVQDRPRLNKPPMIYWLQAGAAAALTWGNPWRDEIWMYRVPSVLAAVAVVLMVRRLAGWMFDRGTGRMGAAILAVCPVMVWEAHQARADMVLVAWTVLAQMALWRVFSSARGEAGDRSSVGRWAVVFWVAVAGGVLTKGPITPLVCGLTVIGVSVVTRRWRWMWKLRPVLGVALVAAAVGPWVWAVAQHVGWDTYIGTIRDEVLGRSVSAKEGHWGPPGYHLVLLPVLFWPGSLLTGLGLGLAVKQAFKRGDGTGLGGGGGVEGAGREGLRHRIRRMSEVRAEGEPYVFLLAWIVPAWLVFEAVGTKLPHYTMPMYPAVAILSTRAVLAAAAGVLPGVKRVGSKIGFTVWWVIGAGIVAAAAGIAVVMARGAWGWPPVWALVLLAFAGGYLLPVCGMQLVKGRASGAQVAGLALAVVVWPALLGGLIPRHKDVWISDRVVGAVRAVDPAMSRPLAAVGYQEDSLVYLTRGRVKKLDMEALAAWGRGNPGALVVMPHAMVEGVAGSVVGRVSGFSYVKGRRVDLAVVELAPVGGGAP